MLNVFDFPPPEFVFSTPKTQNYRSFLIDLARKFKKDDLDDLKFAVKDVIPDDELEDINHARDVFSAMERRTLLGPSKLDTLREYLEAIDRPNLIEMLDEFDDADTKFPLKPRSDNFLEKDGYKVSIKGGRHFDTSQGEFVEVRSGSNYSITLVNENNHRCEVSIFIDGYEIFPKGLLLGPKESDTIDRPERLAEKFKFFAIADAPPGSGINKWRKGENGLVHVKFSPEKADMKIICVASGTMAQVISCSIMVTDVEFHEMVSEVFNNSIATIMLNGWKPLGKRGAQLVQYDIGDGSRVDVIFGGIGGVLYKPGFHIKKNGPTKKDIKWRAGATTLEDKSDQKFGKADGFPIDPCQVTTLSLRLVARENEIPLPSTGNPRPLTRATLIPPPVPN